MRNTRKNLATRIVPILIAVPLLIYAYASGPDPRHTGAPGDQTCTACHLGSPLNPTANGLRIDAGGTTYTPGETKRIQVVFNVQSAVYGFQATVRPVSNLANGQAGALQPISGDSTVFVQCENGRPTPCPANAPVQFIEHNRPRAQGTFQFDWVAPATDIGPVRIYAAGNSANGNGQNTGDRIYTATLELTPAAAQQKPAISQNGVLDVWTGRPLVTSGTWLTIYGTLLSTATREWAGSDFTNNQGPTSLDGVGVNIGGKPAIMRYVSPGQLNVQAPMDLPASGPVNVEVVNAAGTSSAQTVTVSKTAPVLLTSTLFNVGGRQYAAALYPDFVTYVGREGLVPGVVSRPAKPGDTIILLGIGFGSTNPAIPAGQIVTQLAPISSSLRILFGQTQADVAYAGLAPNFVGLYQFNVVVPNVDNGDVQLNVELDGQRVDQTLYLTVQR